MDKPVLAKSKAITIFLVFALGYFISNLLRAITATIAPELVSEFNLTSGELGLLGGAYFLGFASVQIPLGYLLDSKGPRKIVSFFFIINNYWINFIFISSKFNDASNFKSINWSWCWRMFNGTFNCLQNLVSR